MVTEPRADRSLRGSAVRAMAAAGLGHVDVWALDLSRPEPTFAAEIAAPVTGRGVRVEPAAATSCRTIGFRPLARADFSAVVGWQSQPHVARWWGWEEPEEHYGPAIDGDDPTRLWVSEVNGRSVGLLQDYRVGDHSDYALLTARPDAIGFDYLIGDPVWVGRGIGTRLLWTFLSRVVGPGYPGAVEFFAAPDHRNAASLRVLDKLGFTRGLWFDEPRSDGGVDTVVGCSLDVRRVIG